MGEELARMADQAAVWLLVDAVPWFVSLVSSLWEFLVAKSQALNHLALIAIGAIGIPLLWIRTGAADRQARAANAQARTGEQGHITDRFTKAIEQLGSKEMAVRLGAIYALERLSRDSPDDHWTIMEVLTAYVRDNSPWPPKQTVGNPFVELQVGDEDRWTEEGEEKIRLATDIQAILTVLGRRGKKACERDDGRGRPLNLSKTDLPGLFLAAPYLRGAVFSGSNLRRAYLPKANLENALLSETDLRDARLYLANLENASLCGADLRGAKLGGAKLHGAMLWRADLRGASMTEATGLTVEQLRWAVGDCTTVLPDGEGIRHPASWPKPKKAPSLTTPPPSPPPPAEAPPDTPTHTSR